jgi:hypothetical protein
MNYQQRHYNSHILDYTSEDRRKSEARQRYNHRVEYRGLNLNRWMNKMLTDKREGSVQIVCMEILYKAFLLHGLIKYTQIQHFREADYVYNCMETTRLYRHTLETFRERCFRPITFGGLLAVYLGDDQYVIGKEKNVVTWLEMNKIGWVRFTRELQYHDLGDVDGFRRSLIRRQNFNWAGRNPL